MNYIIAVKDMSAGNAEVGEMWQETKAFKFTDTLRDVMLWVGQRQKNVVLTVPDGVPFPEPKPQAEEPLPFWWTFVTYKLVLS